VGQRRKQKWGVEEGSTVQTKFLTKKKEGEGGEAKNCVIRGKNSKVGSDKGREKPPFLERGTKKIGSKGKKVMYGIEGVLFSAQDFKRGDGGLGGKLGSRYTKSGGVGVGGVSG